MTDTRAEDLILNEGRFARLEAIEWWNQSLLSQARILVVGAGALGNEVIKNLALLGVGSVVIIDMDRIELSNLSRSVLFRAEDEGEFKATRAAAAAEAIYPEMMVHSIAGNLLADAGLGLIRWANVVVGALDNREARVFLNSACAAVGRTWFDAGIEVLQGVVRGFTPAQTACYECTMSAVDWELLNRRRSCSLLARRSIAARGTPTTPTIASIIAGIQVQEVVKFLHGFEALVGSGYVFEGRTHSSYLVRYPLSPDCPWHDSPAEVVARDDFHSGTPLADVWQFAVDILEGLDALDLSRELLRRLICPACEAFETVLAPIERISESQAVCPRCGTERVPEPFHSITAGSELLSKTIAEIGLPPWDIIWARKGEKVTGIEISGDRLFQAGE